CNNPGPSKATNIAATPLSTPFRQITATLLSQRSNFTKTYEHGPESWTDKWTHVKPGWHPVFFRLASTFGGDSLANCCGLVSSARWQLDQLQLPQVSYNAPLHFRLLLTAGFGWLSRTKGGHSRACFRLFSGSPVENARARGRETGGGEGGIRL